MIEKDKIVYLLENKLIDTNCFLVDVAIHPGNLIVVELDSDQGVGIDDCALLSRYLESNLDREEEDFELEVSSAGITSPFKIIRQYKKNVGNEVEVLLKTGIKETGLLKTADDVSIVLQIEKMIKPEGAKRKVKMTEDIIYPYGDIKYTKNIIRFK